MELRRFDPTKEYAPRSVFSLVGTLLKETEKSILVQIVNGNAKFGIDKNGGKPSLSEGELGTFQITISTYIGKDGDLIWTKPRMQTALKLKGDVQSDHPGFHGLREGKITSYFQTDIKNLWIVNFETNEGEKFILRYFSDKSPIEKNCVVSLELRSTSKLVDAEGRIFEAFRKFSYKDKVSGEEIKREEKRWFPCLQLAGLTYSI